MIYNWLFVHNAEHLPTFIVFHNEWAQQFCVGPGLGLNLRAISQAEVKTQTLGEFEGI